MAGPAVMAIKIVGDATGATNALNGAGGFLSKFTAKFGKAGPLVAAGIAAIPVAALAAAKGLYNIGAEFDGMYDTIRVGTGATGQAFEALKDSARNVAASVPADFDKIGKSLADVNTRTGLTGKTLETVSSQFLEAGRILGEEINIQKATGALNSFNITGKQTEAGMDTLFRVSQATGISMNDLSSVLGRNAPALQSLGFSFNESAAMAGLLNKSGLDANKTLGSMGKALLEVSKSGEKPADAFKRVTGQMGEMLKKGDEAGALNLASKLFGTRGAPQFIGALKSGAINMDAIGKAAQGSGDTILGVGKETADAAEAWQLLKNNAKLALEPLASGVFNALGQTLGWLADKIKLLTGSGGLSSLGQAFDSPALKSAGAIFQSIGSQISSVYQTAKPALAEIASTVKPIFLSLLPVVSSNVTAICGIIKGAFGIIKGIVQVFKGILTGDWSSLWDGIKSILSGVWSAISGIVTGAFGLIKTIFTSALAGVKNIWSGAWGGIKNLASTIFGAVSSVIGNVWGKIKSVFTSGINLIRNIWSAGWGWVKNKASSIWHGITGAISSGVSKAISVVKSLPSKAVKAIGNLGSKLLGAGKDLIQGMINGVGSMGSAIWDACKNIAKKAISSIKNFLGIASPSKVFTLIGKQTGQGFINGIESMAGDARRASKNLVSIPASQPIPKISARINPYQPHHPGQVAPINITVNGALDPLAVARQIKQLLTSLERGRGQITIHSGAAIA